MKKKLSSILWGFRTEHVVFLDPKFKKTIDNDGYFSYIEERSDDIVHAYQALNGDIYHFIFRGGHKPKVFNLRKNG